MINQTLNTFVNLKLIKYICEFEAFEFQVHVCQIHILIGATSSIYLEKCQSDTNEGIDLYFSSELRF